MYPINGLIERINTAKELDAMKFGLSCFSHPIQIIALDDSEIFLKILRLQFSNDMNLVTFVDPQEAINVTQNIESISQDVINECDNLESDFIGQYGINYNLKNLHKIIYNTSRFNYPAILIVDLHMPDMDGLDVCRNIRNNNLLKVIVTGDEDKNIAITAFNENLIQKYLIKSDKNLFSNLLNTINDLTDKYFFELSKPLIANNSNLKKLFEDQFYIQLFHQIKREGKIIEHYLIDNSGSFVFLNNENEPIWLLVKSEEEYIQQLEMLEGFDVPHSLTSSLENREKLLFLPSEQEFKKTVQQWNDDHTFPATKLGDKYYFSIVKGKVFDLINWEEVTFYKNAKSSAEVF